MKKYNINGYKGQVSIECTASSDQNSDVVHVLTVHGESLYKSEPMKTSDLKKLYRSLKREFNVVEINDDLIYTPEGCFISY